MSRGAQIVTSNYEAGRVSHDLRHHPGHQAKSSAGLLDLDLCRCEQRDPELVHEEAAHALAEQEPAPFQGVEPGIGPMVNAARQAFDDVRGGGARGVDE
jgi:hypothetical protein